MSEIADWIEAILVFLVLVAAFAAVSIWYGVADAWDWLKNKAKGK